MTSCADDGSPGTLRYEVINAPSGAMIDLSALACSTITLDGNWPIPELQVMQDTLYLKGPADRGLTIDGAGHSSVFRHFGTGTLGITDLNVTNGYYISNGQHGGCIYSAGNLDLTRSVVSNCVIVGASAAARPVGGGVCTKGNLTLSSSIIADSTASSAGPNRAEGAGAFVYQDFHAYYSTISDNAAYAKYANTYSAAGGIRVLGNVTVQGSTISGNSADAVGGIAITGGSGHSANVSNSTISDNTSIRKFGGVFTTVALKLSNSTVAFNTVRASGSYVGAGLYSNWLLTLQSSIIADNASENGPSDLGSGPLGAITGSSANNLITSSTLVLPVGTIQDCPRLQPLADNGGPTRTHAPGHNSPVLDNGNNAAGLTSDQRLATRVVNAQADIGAVEWQPGEIDERIFVSGFDGVCDR